MPWSRRYPRFRLDVVDARESVLAREVIPFLVVAGDRLAAEDHRLLEPTAQPGHERHTLVLLRVQEVEQLALPVQVCQRLPAQQLLELVPEQSAVNPLLEVFLARREVLSVLRGDALQ